MGTFRQDKNFASFVQLLPLAKLNHIKYFPVCVNDYIVDVMTLTVFATKSGEMFMQAIQECCNYSSFGEIFLGEQ